MNAKGEYACNDGRLYVSALYWGYRTFSKDLGNLSYSSHIPLPVMIVGG